MWQNPSGGTGRGQGEYPQNEDKSDAHNFSLARV